MPKLVTLRTGASHFWQQVAVIFLMAWLKGEPAAGLALRGYVVGCSFLCACRMVGVHWY